MNPSRPLILATALLATLAVPAAASAAGLGTTNVQKKHLATITHEPVTAR
ncbi:hypothetical protein DVA67_004710 [Solirubrobacter sp. CPCC 204708]|uniref:Uncharacterized protein n=1 Tax=Solirubrobacter deserti TaxID=2282478 RepID=A0ABT4RHD4_9ACTN|nr:hypothetical protein [Solirubrobacter deserti]MBE2315263.1 hypothetical protein [Solirubrobacter deserti]MDA0137947.1 hypothetical protein [Solirubrobacter deserti]